FSDYPRAYVHQAFTTIADWTFQAITVNQDGLHVYVNTLSGADDTSARTVASFTIPAVPADPQKPASTSGNMYNDASSASKWQQILKANHQKVRSLQEQFKPQIESLRFLNPPLASPVS